MEALRAVSYLVFCWTIFVILMTVASATPPVRPGTGNPSPRLPRTSASQLSQLNNVTGIKANATKNPNTQRNGNLRTRSVNMKYPSGEQQLLNVFEVVVSTLEGKLQRIDNLDKAVENLMRRVEQLDDRVADNILKTDSVISNLQNLDNKISIDNQDIGQFGSSLKMSSNVLESSLLSLDQKVSDIDSKLEGLKSQIDNNFLPVDDINAEASEKKPISMNVIEITRSMNAEVISHVTNELGDLKSTTEDLDKKLQFHINLVSENIGKVLRMIGDIHEAVVDHQEDITHNSTTTQAPMIRTSKIDALVNQMKPIMTVSEKMDEVWDVVVGTKSSVDDLVPKSDELLTQTQRQERAIGEIHHDLKTKTNLIINNLDIVEKRLKKQEDNVAVLAQRPVPPELLMDPTIDRLVEYDHNRYSLYEDFTEPPLPPTTFPPGPSTTTQTNGYVNLTTQNSNTIPYVNGTTSKPVSRKGGIIFPSVKNKPSVVNSTFATDALSYKDVKGFSCIDLQNAGMRHSGVYYLQIRGTTYWFLKVFCEQEIADGGWTVIQRRDDFGEPRENFNRDWADYKNGFGDPAKEFWLGNENIYMLTNNEDYSLRVELEDFEGNKRYAQYSHFKIHSESDYYKLEIDGYDGNAGDSLNDPWYGSNNSPFSTYNRDNDRSSLNCASMLKGFSCIDLQNAGMRHSGVYYLQIRGTTYWFLKVFCEQEIADGGWTVIQRRDDFGEPRENFNRDWADYKNGFGDPAKEFWLGNENIYMLTNNEDYSLRVELEDFEGNKRYAQYSHFKIHSESDYYKLEIDGYDGNAGDSLNDPWYGSNNSPFSTYNRDNDRSSLNCASMLKGGWWWKSCGRGLNGLYLHDPQDLTARQGIVWFRWRGWDYTLKKATLMIRPKGPQQPVPLAK